LVLFFGVEVVVGKTVVSVEGASVAVTCGDCVDGVVVAMIYPAEERKPDEGVEDVSTMGVARRVDGK
jgi:hypothetical protein